MSAFAHFERDLVRERQREGSLWRRGVRETEAFSNTHAGEGAEEAAKLGITVSMTQVRSNGSQLAEFGRLLDAGTVRVAIDSTFPLADARKAHERAAGGHIQGKIVLTVA